MKKKVLVPIADGTEELEAVTIIDTLRRAGAEVTVASVSDGLTVTASRGVKLTADRPIRACIHDTYDLIALPGGMPGAEHLRDCEELIDLLRVQKNENRLIGAICASPAVVLAAHGLLDDRKATCYPSFQDKLPNASNNVVVVDSNVITSQGPGTALPFALELVSRLLGAEIARKVAGPMLVQYTPR
jgi:4-methyl-5(b-hydroxyethyl)-thiazole monophosphate biosynthesis